MRTAFVAQQRLMSFACLFTDATTLHLAAYHVDTTSAQITLLVRSTRPRTSSPARRIHSRYTDCRIYRAEYRARLPASAGGSAKNRHRCRRIFTERPPPWPPLGGDPAFASARRTRRGPWGQGRVHLANAGPVVSRNTLLRLLRRPPVPSPTPRPRVDDFALRETPDPWYC